MTSVEFCGVQSWAATAYTEVAPRSGRPSTWVYEPEPAATQTTDWEALAAQVYANYEATGQWFI